MKVKLANPDHAAGLIDPVTMRSPFIVVDETTNGDGSVTRTNRVVPIADVPDNTHWQRRLIAKEIEIVEDTTPAAASARAQPTGIEPVKPLTTR